MKTAALIALLALMAPAAWAADFDFGFARPGMTLDEFRASTWPAGVSVRCSGEADLPPESATVRLSVPSPVARLGGTRCGLFTKNGGNWQTSGIDMAGTATEVWGKFFPDRDGTPRLVQLLLKQPPKAFDALADHFTQRFGAPAVRQAKLARWETEEAEATIIEDGGRTLLAFVIDTRLQSALNARMSHQPRQSGAKDSPQ
ncbi:MAG TPA: hypothetical protein VL974_05820 [Magnetospirillum sp.]|nr:hypothetical protein [Magnetospirillum sp.]